MKTEDKELHDVQGLTNVKLQIWGFLMARLHMWHVRVGQSHLDRSRHHSNDHCSLKHMTRHSALNAPDTACDPLRRRGYELSVLAYDAHHHITYDKPPKCEASYTWQAASTQSFLETSPITLATPECARTDARIDRTTSFKKLQPRRTTP